MLPGHDINSEKALELAIESGAADVQETEDEEEKPLLKVRFEVFDSAIVSFII